MLELRDLTCVRGGRRLFTGLSALVARGELLRVHGANGAGKTSLLRMLCGVLAPAQGEIRWQGQRIAALHEEYGRQLVYLGHAAALKDDLTALENLVAAGVLAGIALREVDALAALAESGLVGRESWPARTLSQGQRRRVALARLVLSGAVPLWVLDEPFVSLDADACKWLLTLISAHLGRGGIVVLTSHQPVQLPEAIRQVSIQL
jgi:heme exporter protein A